jgi:hypothetical protein
MQSWPFRPTERLSPLYSSQGSKIDVGPEGSPPKGFSAGKIESESQSVALLGQR